MKALTLFAGGLLGLMISESPVAATVTEANAIFGPTASSRTRIVPLPAAKAPALVVAQGTPKGMMEDEKPASKTKTGKVPGSTKGIVPGTKQGTKTQPTKSSLGSAKSIVDPSFTPAPKK